MKLWVDDIRPAPEGWKWAKDCRTANLHLYYDDVTELSLDHDLGGDQTTREIVMYMIEFGIWPEQIYCHSANPVGREWILGMIERYKP